MGAINTRAIECSLQWRDANTGKPINMTAPDIIAFRRGDIREALRLLAIERINNRYPKSIL